MNIVEQTAQFVRKTLEGAEGGHDWWHTHRVWQTAITIGKQESADMLVVELAALLHDIADSKFYDGDEDIGPARAGSFLQSHSVESAVIAHVQNIIKNMSYKSSLGKLDFHSKELEVVQDADRLDAIGAIGIARAFSYGGFKQRALYDPAIPPNSYMSKEEYKNSSAPTINHFYEKLLLLKDKMNTKAGRLLAVQRHEFMERYLKQFYHEWKGQ